MTLGLMKRMSSVDSKLEAVCLVSSTWSPRAEVAAEALESLACCLVAL